MYGFKIMWVWVVLAGAGVQRSKTAFIALEMSLNTCSACKLFSDVIVHDLCTMFHIICVRECNFFVSSPVSSSSSSSAKISTHQTYSKTHTECGSETGSEEIFWHECKHKLPTITNMYNAQLALFRNALSILLFHSKCNSIRWNACV